MTASVRIRGKVPVFVFGSNLRGHHGAGAAKWARERRGAVHGVSFGKTGNSFAIPTRDDHFQTLSLKLIASYVEEFLQYAEDRPEQDFWVSPVGCGMAGLNPLDVAPLFCSRPPNVHLNTLFERSLNDPG